MSLNCKMVRISGPSTTYRSTQVTAIAGTLLSKFNAYGYKSVSSSGFPTQNSADISIGIKFANSGSAPIIFGQIEPNDSLSFSTPTGYVDMSDLYIYGKGGDGAFLTY